MADEFKAIYDDLLKCNRCGYCQTECPTYKATGKEILAARGHHAYFRDIIEGRLKFTRKMKGHLYDCTLCRACVPPCMPAVPTDKIIVKAREAFIKRFGLRIDKRVAFRLLLSHPGWLALLVKGVGILQRLGFARLAQAARIIPASGERLSFAAALLPRIPYKNLRQRLRANPPKPPEKVRYRLLYFIACGYNFALPEVGEATLRVLYRAGCQVTVAENVCCGLPAYAEGDLEGARRLARKNISRLEAFEGDAIVSDCASCSSFLKEYRHLLSDGDLAPKAERFAKMVMDINEFLAPLIDSLGLKKEIQARVTFHSPCHLGRYQGIREQPRALLKAIPGVEFREMAEAEMCCGAAGTYGVEHPEVSKAILGRKMENLRQSRAEILATSCPACMIQLGHGVRGEGLGTKVAHITELLDESFNFETLTP